MRTEFREHDLSKIRTGWYGLRRFLIRPRSNKHNKIFYSSCNVSYARSHTQLTPPNDVKFKTGYLFIFLHFFKQSECTPGPPLKHPYYKAVRIIAFHLRCRVENPLIYHEYAKYNLKVRIGLICFIFFMEMKLGTSGKIQKLICFVRRKMKRDGFFDSIFCLQFRSVPNQHFNTINNNLIAFAIFSILNPKLMILFRKALWRFLNTENHFKIYGF